MDQLDPSFQEVNRLFVLSFETYTGRASYCRYYLKFVEIKNYNIIIDGQNFFNQQVKNNLITYGPIQNTTTGQGDDYKTDFLLDYNL